MDAMTTITVRIPVSIKQATQAEARRNDRNLSQQVTSVLRPYLLQTASVQKQSVSTANDPES